MKNTVTVTIPSGEYCITNGTKPCILARYAKKMNGYNCTVYNQILKGGQEPRKCRKCISRCNEQAKEAEANCDE